MPSFSLCTDPIGVRICQSCLRNPDRYAEQMPIPYQTWLHPSTNNDKCSDWKGSK